MTQSELANKSKAELVAIAKALGVNGAADLSVDELKENIILLDPPCSAVPEATEFINKQIKAVWDERSDPYRQPPLPEYLLKEISYGTGEESLPQHYNETFITLMVRDPYCLFSYWEISENSRRDLNHKFNDFQKMRLTLRVHDVNQGPPPFFDIPLVQEAENWYIDVPHAAHTYFVELGILQPDGSFYTIARSNNISTPRDSCADFEDASDEFAKSNCPIYDETAQTLKFCGNSQSLLESVRKQLNSEISSGSVSSFSIPQKSKSAERRFWLVLNTELIVYGATEPGSSVNISGQNVKLNPDGTFSIRLALPDGHYCLPVTAQSSDGIDCMTITPIVDKETG